MPTPERAEELTWLCLLVIVAALVCLARPARPQQDVALREARTWSLRAQMPNEPGNVAQLCAIACDADPTLLASRLLCVPANPDQVLELDVSALMAESVPTCLRGITVSPTGLVSVASSSAARGNARRSAADCNRDGSVDVRDVVCVGNAIFAGS